MLFPDVKWKFHHNYHMLYRNVANKMDDDIGDSFYDIKWNFSPPENRFYPQHVKNNKCAF